MKPLPGAVVLSGLFVATAGITLAVGNGSLFLAVLGGGLVPWIVSVSSLVLFFQWLPRRSGAMKHEKFVLLNFLVKVILIGGWVTLILMLTAWPVRAFIISLVVNFLAWHLYEAYCYQRFHLTSLRRSATAA